MKKLCLFIPLFVLGCLLPSCKTYQHTSRTSAIQQRGIAVHQMTADMRVDFSVKVNGESRRDCLSRREAIENALNNAIAAAHVDVVIDPIYEVEVHRKFARIHYYAKVTGFAGYYNKVETIDEIDKEVQRVSNLSMDDIVKYKLLTDPNFVDQYYQRDMIDNSNRTNIYFNNGNGNQSVGVGAGAAPAKRNTFNIPAKQKPAASPIINNVSNRNMPLRDYGQDFKKAKQIRDAGIGMLVGGAVLAFPVGVTTWVTTGAYEIGIPLLVIGAASTFAVGIPCIAVGQVRMDKIKKSNYNLTLAPASSGMGLKLQF